MGSSLPRACKAHTELYTHEHDYKYGSNKKIRNKAEREMGYVKHRIEYLLTKKYTEIYMMQASDEAVAAIVEQ